MILALFCWTSSLRRAVAAHEPVIQPEPFLSGPTNSAAQAFARTYRVDAAVLILSMPVYRREGVGNAQASVAEVIRPDGRHLSIEFAGASRPDRAAGLTRSGSIHETVLERRAVPCEAAYLGVLTSSKEETIEEARLSMNQPTTDCNEFTAIDGSHTSGRSRSAITHFRLPSSRTPELHSVEQARASFREGKATWRESAWPSDPEGRAPLTFLYALRTAIQATERITETRYVYNERSYRLRVEKELDAQQGLRLAQLGLVEQPAQVVQVRARIREEQSGRQTTFRLWLENPRQAGPPVRIELCPRPYLRLTLEAEPRKPRTPIVEEP